MDYTNAEYAVLWSVPLTVVLCIGTVFYLRGPMRGILKDRCPSEDRARFWLAFSNLVVVLLPLICLLTAYVGGGPTTYPFLTELAIQMRWSLLGLFLSIICLAVVVANIPAESLHQIIVDNHQVDNLKLLLARIEELRARDILKHSNAS